MKRTDEKYFNESKEVPVTNNKECCQHSRYPCSREHPCYQIDDGQEEALEAEHRVDIEEDWFPVWTDEGAIDSCQEQLLVDVESMENVYGSRREKHR